MSTRPTLLLVHGWGFDADVWTSLRAALGDPDAVTIDLGFDGHPVDLETVPNRVIAVGHSLGFLWLAEVLAGRESDALSPWPRAVAAVRGGCVGLVSVNGFTRFARSPEFRAGVAPRVLSRMTARAADDAAGLVHDFRAQCGMPEGTDAGPADPEPGRLAAGLGWLGDWDARAAFEASLPPCLALAAADDAIVGKAHAEACFVDLNDVRLAWSETGNHLLPLTRPDWCAEHIRRFAEEVAA